MVWHGQDQLCICLLCTASPSLHMNMKRKELTRSEIHSRKDVKYNRLSDAL